MKFTKEQITDLRWVVDYVTEQPEGLRKGKVQTRYVITIPDKECIWCEKTEDLVRPQKEFIGYYIQRYPTDNSYENYMERFEDEYQEWVKCEEVEVVTTQWKEVK